MTVSEVGQKYGISQDTLRYYERIGLIPRVNRNKSGFRDYTEEDCNWVGFIKCMRDAGLSIEVLTEYVGMFQQGDTTVETRKELFVEQRKLLIKRIAAVQKTIERLDYKIAKFDKTIVEREKRLTRLED